MTQNVPPENNSNTALNRYKYLLSTANPQEIEKGSPGSTRAGQGGEGAQHAERHLIVRGEDGVDDLLAGGALGDAEGCARVAGARGVRVLAGPGGVVVARLLAAHRAPWGGGSDRLAAFSRRGHGQA